MRSTVHGLLYVGHWKQLCDMEMTFPDTRKNIVADSDSTSAVQLKKKKKTLYDGPQWKQ